MLKNSTVKPMHESLVSSIIECMLNLFLSRKAATRKELSQ